MSSDSAPDTEFQQRPAAPSPNTSNASSGGLGNGAALFVMLITPLLFATNVVFGRAAVAEVNPFTLAMLRWAFVAAILYPFCRKALAANMDALREHGPLLIGMGFMGNFICGGVFYLALQYTTAANGALIYSAVPAVLIVIERLFFGRAIVAKEILGISIAMAGIVVIVMRGSWDVLLSFAFNPGDLLVLVAVFSWSLYSIFLRRPVFQAMNNTSVLCIIAIFGTALLLPAAVFEIIVTDHFPASADAWLSIAAIVLFSSLGAFLGYQFSVRRLGATVGSLFMYLMPIYGLILAAALLGETIQTFHLWGTCLVLGGVALATLKLSQLSIFRSQKT